MKAPVITFFNNKGGVGKTSLVYHVAWMLNDLGVRTVAVDLDPQANLTAAFMQDNALEALWSDPPGVGTIFGCINPLTRGVGDVQAPSLTAIAEDLHLLCGDLRLSSLEDELSGRWPDCLSGNERAFRVITAFWRVMQLGAKEVDAKVILADVGPNLGALNRAAMVATDHVIMPLAADLFSMKGLENLGPTLRAWREQWAERMPKSPDKSFLLPNGDMRPAGYILMQHAVRLDRPVQAYQQWMERAPGIYAKAVLNMSPKQTRGTDGNLIAMIKHYRSLMPMAQEHRKPMFHLKAADGAIGGHVKAVQGCYTDFEKLSRDILQRTGLPQLTHAN